MHKEVYHIQKRKRVYKKLEEYPSKRKWIRRLDKLILSLAFIGPVVELPQLIKIFLEKTAAGVSLFTWFFFVIFSIPWLFYGIVHKDKPIIVIHLLWIIIDSAIVVGILLYG